MNVNPKVILIVVLAESTLAFIGLGTLALSLFYKTYADPAILTALITITSGVVGSLTTLLTSPRSMPPETAAATTPVPVKVAQPANEPIPVVTTDK